MPAPANPDKQQSKEQDYDSDIPEYACVVPPVEAATKKHRIAAEAPAVGDNHALAAAVRHLNLGGDAIRLVENVRRSAGRHSKQLAGIGEESSSHLEARALGVPTCQRRIIKRQYGVLRCFRVKKVLQLLELIRH